MATYKHWDFSGVDIINLALHLLVALNPALSLIESERIIFNRVSILDPKKKVVVISGGGSGHEPLHAGVVGLNFLDAAVAGSMFASPSTKQILSAIVSILDLTKEAGLPQKDFLIIVKNYTGDILHFGLALERAKSLGFNAEMVIVQDDVSVGKTNGGFVGRRGLAGTALVHKVAGGLAAEGADLKTVTAGANAVVEGLVTIGASLDHCSLPGHKAEDSGLKVDQCEIGMGIHNETGVKRITIPKVNELVEELLNFMLDLSDKDRAFVDFEKSDSSVLLINNLGGTSNLELSALAELVLEQLKSKHSIVPERVYIGSFVTSLNGNGFLATLLNLNKAGGKEKVLTLLDKPTDCIGWNSTINWNPKSKIPSVLKTATTDVNEKSKNVVSSYKVDKKLVKAIFDGAIERTKTIEPRVTKYDTVAGDGDCGETLLAGSKAVEDALKDESSALSKHLDDPVAVIFNLANLLEDSMGGTSGGIYSIFMSSLAVALKKENALEFNVKLLAKGLEEALESLFKYTRARVGDKTLIDALEPFISTLSKTGDLKAARNAAIKSAKATKKLDAKFGRASYVSKEELKKFQTESKGKSTEGDEEDLDVDDDEEGVPDPGAIGLAGIFDGAVKAYYA